MRAFIAIELNRSIKDEIASKHNYIKSISTTCRITKISNLHITLKFLGQVTSQQIENIKTVMDNEAKSFNNFNIQLSEWGSFRGKKGKILWAGVSNEDILKDLSNNLNKNLKINGIDTNFKAHITVARDCVFNNDINNLPSFKKINQEVNCMVLYKSVLNNKSVCYEELHRSMF